MLCGRTLSESWVALHWGGHVQSTMVLYSLRDSAQSTLQFQQSTKITFQVHLYCSSTTKCIHTLHHAHLHFSYTLLHVVHPCCFSALFLSSKHSGHSFSTLLSCNILHIVITTSYTTLHKALANVLHCVHHIYVNNMKVYDEYVVYVCEMYIW